MGVIEISKNANCLINRIGQTFQSPKTHWMIIAFGAIFRIAQYFYNRSLTEGEAALALNIIKRSFPALLQPLDYVQAAPVGFLLAQRLVLKIGGASEYALRFLPLVASILALYIFYKIARKTVSDQALPVAIILFAVCDHVIYFASEIKQYSSDVLFALLLIMIIVSIIKSRKILILAFIFVITGSVALWFSHPSLFIFTAGIIIIILLLIKAKQLSGLIYFTLFSLIALTSFIVNYHVSLSQVNQNSALFGFWQQAFIPFPPTSLNDIRLYVHFFLRIFKFPVGLSIFELFLAVISFITGCIIILNKKKYIGLALLLPIMLTVIAAILHRYPFEGRLILFITPILILFIAQGLEYIRYSTAQGSQLLGACLVLIILVQPIGSAIYHVFKPRAPEELRPVMEFVDDHYQQDDVVYVYYASVNAYRYYAPRFDYADNYIIGIEARTDWINYYHDLKKLQGKTRVWVLLSHIATTYGCDEKQLFVMFLDMLGKQQKSFKAPGAACYLYDLSE